jgi:hypothetical protein
MESIREQMDLSNEISDAISNPVNMGIEVDDVSFDLQLRREIVTGGPTSCTRHVKFELIICALPFIAGRIEERARRIGAGTAERAFGWCREGTGARSRQCGSIESLTSAR